MKKRVYILYAYGVMICVMLIFSTGACTIGGNISKSEVATRPHGDTIDVELTDGNELSGELLTLRDQSVILLTRDGCKGVLCKELNETSLPAVARITFNISRNIRLDYRNREIVDDGEIADEESLQNYISFSRYPQGISAGLMQQLLDAYNQKTLVVIE